MGSFNFFFYNTNANYLTLNEHTSLMIPVQVLLIKNQTHMDLVVVEQSASL